MKIAILGFGREGKAIFKYLKKNKAYKNAEIFVLDKNSTTKVPAKIGLISGENHIASLKSFDLVFRSPGVPYNSPTIQDAVRSGVKFTSATQIFFDEARGAIIGVTGTKGKGTTSTLLYNILKAAKYDVYLAGNIGKPAIDILPKLKKNSVTILELSSFQLHDLRKSPQTAVILDIFPDHMDSHTDFQDYFNAKANIARYQSAKDKVFYCGENEHSRNMAQSGDGQKIAVIVKNFDLFQPEDLKITGPHNFKNAVMAATVALNFGIPKSVITETVKSFKGLPHRLEFTRAIKSNSGAIKFYNDSAGTNPQTAAAAVKSFSEPLILIAGGKDKNLDYAPLAEAIKKSPSVKAVVLFGENKLKIKEALERIKNNELRIVGKDDLESAVNEAYKIAKSSIIHNSQFIVLFSPGAASFDMFKDYADRGEKFKEIVTSIY